MTHGSTNISGSWSNGDVPEYAWKDLRNPEQTQAWHPVSRHTFEPRISYLRSRSTRHSSTSFSFSLKEVRR